MGRAVRYFSKAFPVSLEETNGMSGIQPEVSEQRMSQDGGTESGAGGAQQAPSSFYKLRPRNVHKTGSSSSPSETTHTSHGHTSKSDSDWVPSDPEHEGSEMGMLPAPYASEEEHQNTISLIEPASPQSLEKYELGRRYRERDLVLSNSDRSKGKEIQLPRDVPIRARAPGKYPASPPTRVPNHPRSELGHSSSRALATSKPHDSSSTAGHDDNSCKNIMGSSSSSSGRFRRELVQSLDKNPHSPTGSEAMRDEDKVMNIMLEEVEMFQNAVMEEVDPIIDEALKQHKKRMHSDSMATSSISYERDRKSRIVELLINKEIEGMEYDIMCHIVNGAQKLAAEMTSIGNISSQI